MDQFKAIHYSEPAAQRALAQLAPEEALRWFEQALELFGRTPSEDVPTYIQLQIGLGEAQRQCGIAGYRDTLLEASRTADSIGAIDLLVRAVLANYRGIWSAVGEPDEERITMINRALERLPADGTVEQAQLLGLACVERTWSTDDLADRLALADQAIDAARRSCDMEILAVTLTQTCELINSPPTAELRATRIGEACEIADGIGSGATRYWAHTDALWTALERADHDGLSRHGEAVDNEAERVPHATIKWNRMFNLVWRTILQGDLREAERLAEAALTYGTETGQPDAFTTYGAQLLNIRYLQGRIHELVPLIEQAVANSPGLPVFRAVLTYALACSEKTEEAVRMLDTDLESGFPMRVDANWLVAFAYWTDSARRLEHVGAAAAIRDQLAPYRDLVPTTRITVRPSVAHHLGLLDHTLGRFDEADRSYSDAMSIHRRMEAPLLVAATQAAWAMTLAERNAGDEHVRANEMAKEALAAATTGGYGQVEADARRALKLLN
jgi:tetratricopeptide (TPR) repeat protein